MLPGQPILQHYSFYYRNATLHPTLHLPSALTPFYVYNQLSSLQQNYLDNLHSTLTFHIKSILYVQHILHHYSLHYRLAAWTFYITFTLHINSVLHSNLLSTLS